MTASNAPKRTLRDIWPHLVVSACALLLPPLGMAAGVVYLGSPHQHEIAVSGPAEHAAVAVAAEPAKASDPVASRTDVTPSVANAVPSPAEQRAAARAAGRGAPCSCARCCPRTGEHQGCRDQRHRRQQGCGQHQGRSRRQGRGHQGCSAGCGVAGRRQNRRDIRVQRAGGSHTAGRDRGHAGCSRQRAAIRPEVAARLARSCAAGTRSLDHRHLRRASLPLTRAQETDAARA